MAMRRGWAKERALKVEGGGEECSERWVEAKAYCFSDRHGTFLDYKLSCHFRNDCFEGRRGKCRHIS
jgi:hypothetical protein